MVRSSIYEDIAKRTKGDIYIGVVGPVRTGKSTFIKRFMEEMVLPNIADEDARARARDELPQSASGKTVMTAEPKFIPERGAHLKTAGGLNMNLRMVDCVGFPVEGALGAEENGEARLVNTPWSEEKMEFSAAARLGTEKVMRRQSLAAARRISDPPRKHRPARLDPGARRGSPAARGDLPRGGCRRRGAGEDRRAAPRL